MIKVLIIDDHEMVRIGLSAFLESEPDIEVVGESSSGEEGVRLALEKKPDVVLMDLVMEGMGGVEATRQIVEKVEGVRVIVLTSFLDDDKVYPVLAAGAMSYLLKTSQSEEIAAAIRAAVRGKSVFEPKVTGKVISQGERERKEDERFALLTKSPTV